MFKISAKDCLILTMLNSFSFQRRSSYTANFTKPICQSPFNIIFYFQTELKITACICPTGIVKLASMEVINMNYIQHHVFSTDEDSYVRKLKVFVTTLTLTLINRLIHGQLTQKAALQ